MSSFYFAFLLLIYVSISWCDAVEQIPFTEWNEVNQKIFSEQELPLVMLFVSAEDSESKSTIEVVRAVSVSFRGEANFCYFQM
jgi:hypothetical protein